MASVSATTVRFTEEFKKHFCERREAGIPVRQIFENSGIDPLILGEKRIEGFAYTVRKQHQRKEGFADQRAENHAVSKPEGEPTLEMRVSQL